MRMHRAATGAAAVLVLAGGGILMGAAGAQAAPTACHTVIRVVPVTVVVPQQVYENGHWVTRYVPVTRYDTISTIVCD
ncbi:hypothetical protein AQJ30_05480 [Streptomyces longwoodensis]|uniref:Uncharacterized protein n=1 Tax=Streptomyces longwoodensis TaxID=68231 RepID=A0A117QPT6_9ACTN|nr:hypothetical protein [Streptomyces longwoodensis]KUN40134.1 hypothetical protein AQJ30_05480 [Streptomyces longwoodensis]